jgi:hypothetical protein
MSYPWESKAIEAAVQEILDSVEVPAVDPAARRALQRLYYRKRQFGADAPGDLTLLCRTIIESEANGPAALIEPIVLAVDGVMRPEWTATGLRFLEAFDSMNLMSTLEAMKDLGLFAESSLGHYLGMVLRNRLIKIFTPAQPVKVKPPPKLPASVARVPVTERNIAIGLEMLTLRAEIKHNASFGRALRRRFEVDSREATYLMKAARAYGTRPDIYRRLSWRALLALSSPTLPADVRASFEQRIRSGEKVAAHEIRRAAGVRKSGRPKRTEDQPTRRMAA